MSVFSAACHHLALLCCVYILCHAFIIDLLDVQLDAADGMVFLWCLVQSIHMKGRTKAEAVQELGV